ncbi:MAG: MGMT family protein [Planctomycetaceae bacterium]|nr:MGMT family protein [Planctomycetaceae bacterium]MCA9032487.1 MGMT family protein [Planctomycetaceae bacterium]MCB9950256.1 MGMT family protein [Planctomycetaceae bacterium]
MSVLTSHEPFLTELGWIVLQGTKRGVTDLTFGHETLEDAIEATRHWEAGEVDFAWYPKACRLLTKFAAGKRVELAGIPIDTQQMTPFQSRVIEQLRQIPFGSTRTYAELAQLSGSPGAARAVGTVMANNRIPLLLPCHRVVGSNGHLGGYSAPQGLDMKRRLLALEKSQDG